MAYRDFRSAEQNRTRTAAGRHHQGRHDTPIAGHSRANRDHHQGVDEARVRQRAGKTSATFLAKMNPDLRDNSWMRGGTSLLWSADTLKLICPAESVRSLRELLRFHQSGWQEEAVKLIKGRTLVVAGLEA